MLVRRMSVGHLPHNHEPDPEASTAARLLDVAAALFRQKGYASTTTREIAQELELQKGSLYHHIRTKEDLLYRICVESLRRMEEAVTASVDQAPTEDRCRVLIASHLRAALADRDMHAVMLIELRSLSDERRAEVIARRDAYQRLVFDVLNAEQIAGRLRGGIDPKLLTLALLDLLNWVIFWYQPRGERSLEALIAALSDIYLQGASLAVDPQLALPLPVSPMGS